jgi:hypothetical protein
MSEKKITTGGFFRMLFRHALGGDGENPIHTVIKKGLANGSQEAKVIETEAEDSQEAGNSEHERARSKVEAP